MIEALLRMHTINYCIFHLIITIAFNCLCVHSYTISRLFGNHVHVHPIRSQSYVVQSLVSDSNINNYDNSNSRDNNNHNNNTNIQNIQRIKRIHSYSKLKSNSSYDTNITTSYQILFDYIIANKNNDEIHNNIMNDIYIHNHIETKFKYTNVTNVELIKNALEFTYTSMLGKFIYSYIENTYF